MPVPKERLFALAAEAESRHLEGLSAFLRIPSVSTDPAHKADMLRAAEWVADAMRQIGLDDVRVEPTAGHPVVTGGWMVHPDAATVLIYGHYDVQPEEPLGLWESPPFSPQIREGKLFARGASDDKGPVWMHLSALSVLKAAGQAPHVNVKVLIEGEEEIGSAHLGDFVAQHRARLAADAVLISDTPMYPPDVPSLCTGLRGMVSLEATVHGPDHDLHSGLYGGSVQNPLHALAQLVASLHDENGKVAVDGFHDDVLPPEPAERQALSRLAFSEDRWREATGVPELFGEVGYTTLERVWLRPTLEVNGMWGGFTQEGAKTVIPAWAGVKITCRLVPDQDPGRVAGAVVDHLKARVPAGVRLQTHLHDAGAPAVRAPLDHPAVKAAGQALKEAFGRPPVVIRMGGSIPIVSEFQRVLGAQPVLLGFGRTSDRMHAPNEHWDLEDWRRGLRTLLAYWDALSF